jgi:thioredoxin-related protein
MWKRLIRVVDVSSSLLSLALLVCISVLLFRPQAGPPSRSSSRSRIQPGQAVQIKDFDWHRKQHTLVLALQTTCRYCAESAVFYQQLLRNQDFADWQAVAVLPQDVDKSKAYMQSQGYFVHNVRQMDLGSLGVIGTPTLFLVDQRGKLERRWVGKLAVAQEEEVTTALGLGKLPHIQDASLELTSGGVTAGSTRIDQYYDQGRPITSEEPGTKSVRLARPHSDDPVRIVGVFENSNDVAPFLHDPSLTSTLKHPVLLWDRVSFQSGSDWLEIMAAAVENLSNKVIVAGELDLRFPETGSGVKGDPFVEQMVDLGLTPEHGLYATVNGQRTEQHSSQQIAIKPGEQIRFALKPYGEAMRQSIERKEDFSKITTCRIGLGLFYFSDGTRWSPWMGYQKPDSEARGKYVKISSEEFGGTIPLEK